jgi:hypothetical protein
MKAQVEYAIAEIAARAFWACIRRLVLRHSGHNSLIMREDPEVGKLVWYTWQEP